MRELLDQLPHRANKFKANAVTPNVHHYNRMKELLIKEIENREKLDKDGVENGVKIALQEYIKRREEDHIHKVRRTNIGKQEVENVVVQSDPTIQTSRYVKVELFSFNFRTYFNFERYFAAGKIQLMINQFETQPLMKFLLKW